MTNYLVTDTELTTVANSIREKGGTTANLSWPTGYVNAVNDIEVGGNAYAVISVTYPSGSTCTCTKGNTVLTAEGTGGLYNFLVPEAGNWTVSCTDGTDNDNQTIDIASQYQIISIELRYADPILNNNSWELINIMAQRGVGDQYWDIGDCKAITLNGKIGNYLTLSNYTTYVFILDFNHPVNKTTADNNIIFGGFKTALTGGIDVCLCDNGYDSYKTSGIYFNINHKSVSNYGGWKGCDFRYDVLGTVETAPSPYNAEKTASTSGFDATITATTTLKTNTLMAALPNDMRSTLKLWTRWVDNTGTSNNIDANVTACIDAGISLLTEFEVFGSRSYANTYEKNHQKQMAYYISGNSKIKYKHNAISTAAIWWESSALCSSSNGFCFVNRDNAGHLNSTASYGLAPIFCVGNTLSYSVIEFTIGTTKYYAQEGMTWQEWVNSEYNTGSWQVLSDTYVSTGAQNIQYNNTDVKPNEIIVANRVYTTRSTGGAAIQ